MQQKNSQSSAVPLKGMKWRVKGRVIGHFFFSTCADVCSHNSSLVWCLHLQIGCNNQQASPSGALILQHLSIVALPRAASSCLGLEQLIGSDVLSFPLKLIRWRQARLPSSSSFRSPVQWCGDIFQSATRKDYQFAACAYSSHWGRYKGHVGDSERSLPFSPSLSLLGKWV